MKVKVSPSTLSGELEIIPSKSDIHRLLICAALADKATSIRLSGSMNFRNLSDDIKATADCLAALGADIVYGFDCNGYPDPQLITVRPIESVNDGACLNCRESGSTLRFILPVAAALITREKILSGREIKLAVTGSGRLPNRPIGELLDALKSGGAHFSADTLPFEVSNGIESGVYSLPGNISSQYITGLLLGLQILGESRIEIEGELKSAAYVDITLAAMKHFSPKVKRLTSAANGAESSAAVGTAVDAETTIGYAITGRQRLTSPGFVKAEGDWSNAAFFEALSVLGKNVKVTGLEKESPQGDKAFKALIETAYKTGKVDIDPTPDLLPIMAVCAAYGKNEVHFVNATRLRLKESDRINSVCKMINDLGGRAESDADSLTIYPQKLVGGEVDSFNDHRIVMSAAIAASVCRLPVTIDGAEAVDKSYPTFFEDFVELGGVVNVI